jgi:hypothetical protein
MRILDKLIENLRFKVKREREELVFALGQASVLSSRAAANKFENLWDAEVRVYSQWGEDGILDFIFSKLGVFKPKVIEVGAGDFSECNSRFLAEFLNASVVAIDGRTDLIKSIDQSNLQWKTHILGIQIWVTPKNINELISKARDFMSGIDMLSLDLDGNDYWIIKEADLTDIKLVVLEYNPLFGSQKALTVPEEDNFDRTKKHYSWLYYGASLKAYVDLMTKKEFKFVGSNRVGNNAFFVAEAYSHLIPFNPDPKDDSYFDWRIRESRDESAQLNFLSGIERQAQIAALPLLDLNENEIVYLRNLGT